MSLNLHPIQLGQEDLVQAVIGSDPAYAERVTGRAGALYIWPPDHDRPALPVLGLPRDEEE